MTKREFKLENEYHYNRSGPVRWIVSHLMRYPIFPIAMILAAVVNNLAYGSIQVFIGRGFDMITTPGWRATELLMIAAGVMGWAAGQGVSGLIRNFSVEFLAQRVERDARDELYVSLLGKSQTFHGRQRIGDIMARATNDLNFVRSLVGPGIMGTVDMMRLPFTLGMMFYFSVRLSLIAAGAIAVVVAAMSPLLPHAFSDDPAVISRATSALLFLALLLLPGAIAFADDGVLIGAGDYRFLGVAAFGYLVAVLPIAVAVLATPSLGIAGIWVGLVVWMVLRAIVNSLRVRRVLPARSD